MGETDAAGLEDLSPSAKLVYVVLEYNGALTQKDIVERTMLPARTVRHALTRLEERGHVAKEIYFRDARQDLYLLTDDADGTEGANVGAGSTVTEG